MSSKENLERMGMTVKQIAEKIGVSKPAIRQKIKRNPELETRLRELSETVGQTVYYNDEAVSMIMALFPTVSDAPETVAENVSGNVSGVSENVSGNVSGVTQPSPEPSERAEREMLRQTIDALTAQLDAKDAQLAEKDTQIAGLTAALSDAQQVQQQLASALETSQQAQKQLSDALAAAQALHAGTIQMQQQQAQQTQPEPPQDAPVVDAAEPEQEGEGRGAMVKEVQEKPLKRGFWAKLFGRKK
jgi:murein DD-endopeptidase MepM/ murein hydrolase activator NlpD